MAGQSDIPSVPYSREDFRVGKCVLKFPAFEETLAIKTSCEFITVIFWADISIASV